MRDTRSYIIHDFQLFLLLLDALLMRNVARSNHETVRFVFEC